MNYADYRLDIGEGRERGEIEVDLRHMVEGCRLMLVVPRSGNDRFPHTYWSTDIPISEIVEACTAHELRHESGTIKHTRDRSGIFSETEFWL